MTEYVYEVRSSHPLNVTNGIGNHPIVMVDPFGQGLVQRDVTRHARSNGAAAADGHQIKLKLLERIDSPSQADRTPEGGA